MDIFGKKKNGLVKKEAMPQASAAVSQTGPDITAFMVRIEQRLSFIEKKMDVLIGQVPARSFEARPYSAPVPQSRPLEVKQSQVRSPARGHARERRERVLHKAVCADCQKECQIPFKPSGERPVYCKECFSKRKADRPAKAPFVERPEPAFSELALPELAVEVTPPVPAGRKVTVTKKGVGKVTVTEIARPGTRDASPKEKTHRAEEKQKK